jgi:hypothetical protein
VTDAVVRVPAVRRRLRALDVPAMIAFTGTGRRGQQQMGAVQTAGDPSHSQGIRGPSASGSGAAPMSVGTGKTRPAAVPLVCAPNLRATTVSQQAARHEAGRRGDRINDDASSQTASLGHRQ